MLMTMFTWDDKQASTIHVKPNNVGQTFSHRSQRVNYLQSSFFTCTERNIHLTTLIIVLYLYTKKYIFNCIIIFFICTQRNIYLTASLYSLSVHKNKYTFNYLHHYSEPQLSFPLYIFYFKLLQLDVFSIMSI
jgi:hypothetical protein